MSIHSFLSELKRRQVYRSVAIYAAVAWALLEGADVVFPRLGFSDASVTLVLILVIVGFPINLYLAWVYDITPEGIFRTPPLSPGTTHRFSWARITEFAVIATLVVAIGYLYIDRLQLQERLAHHEMVEAESPDKPQTPATNPEKYRSIAVLPFKDMSEAGDQTWFAEGIAEELLNALAGVEQLRVMARTSSFAFKNSDRTIAEIAEILGVQAVLEGSVRRSGERVRITAQLIDARTGFRIWSGSYDRQITDIFQLQDDLARSVVETLRIELGVAGSTPLVAEKTRIPEAYNWFIRGRALFDWPNPQATLRSLSHFKKAVKLDPDYAEAWGYISYNYMILMLYRPFSEVGPPAINAYEKALALDPEQNEALTVKALMTQLLEHDWAAAGHIYQHAVTSSKSSHAAMRGYATYYLQFIDRQSQAIELFTRTTNLDPLHAGRRATLAGMLYLVGDYQGAIREARKARELDPQHILAIQYLIDVYTDIGDTDALKALLAGVPRELREQPEIRSTIGWSYAIRGKEDKARAIYRELLDSIESLSPLATFNVAMVALALGNVEESINLLELLEERHSYLPFWSKFIPAAWGPIHEHPRYQSLLKRIGLDQQSVAELHEKMSFD